MRSTTIERELEARGRCLIQTVGVSMEPILHNRYSTVVLEKKKAPPCRGDVVLFRRRADQVAPLEYVLHRIIRVRGNDYLIRGDNCLQTEVCQEEQILGVMTGFFNGERYTDCATDKAYARYTQRLQWRYGWRRLRAFCSRALRWAKRTSGALPTAGYARER